MVAVVTAVPLDAFLRYEDKHFGFSPIRPSNLVCRCTLGLRWSTRRPWSACRTNAMRSISSARRCMRQGGLFLHAVRLKLTVQVNGKPSGRVLGGLPQVDNFFHNATNYQYRAQQPNNHTLCSITGKKSPTSIVCTLAREWLPPQHAISPNICCEQYKPDPQKDPHCREHGIFEQT